MRTLVKSALRFSWAASLVGAEQAVGWLRPAGLLRPEPASAADRHAPLDAIAGTARQQLGDFLQGAYGAGEALQDEFLDLAWSSFEPAQWQRSKERVVRHSADVLHFANPAAGGAARRRELSNKLEVFQLVRGAARQLGLPPLGVPFSLARWVDIALQKPPRRALWLIEGLTHHYLEGALLGRGPSTSADASESDLLAEAELDRLPEHTLPIVHAGLGLAVAEHFLRPLRAGSSPAAFAEAVAQFESLCRASARAPHVDAALEALGLVARCFFADLVPGLDRALAQQPAGELRQVFWHGVGRGLYFVPVSFVPGYGSLGQVLAMVGSEAPDEELAAAARAGVGYAFTLVNLGTPRVLEEALARQGDMLMAGPFHQGLVASVVMRQRTTPEDSELGDFLAYQPREPTRAELWDRVVRQPCQRALDDPGRLAGRYEALAGDRR